MAAKRWDSWKYQEWRRRVIKQTCEACGMPASKQHPLQLDHIIHRHLAPDRVMDRTNVRTLCGWCNRVKGGSMMTLEEVRAVRLGFDDPTPAARTIFGPRRLPRIG